MLLTRVVIEAFRGIRRLELELDPITVVIGENNHGKTSLLDVLGLCLARRDGTRRRFREDDFHRLPDGLTSDIRIVLTFRGDATAGGLPAGSPLLAAQTRDRDGSLGVRAEFFGSPGDRLVRRRFIDEHGRPLHPQPEPATFEDLQDLHPVLLLRLGRPVQKPADEHVPGAVAVERRGRRDLEGLIGQVYHDLTHTRGPLPRSRITGGLRAARHLFGRREPHSPDAAMQRMLSELLSDSEQWGQTKDSTSFRVSAGSGSHSVGLLLVLGALLDVRGDEALPEAARPIIAIEEPSVHLHPILLASTWDVIESLHAQTVVTTNSGELLSSVPMQRLRRLVRRRHGIDVGCLRQGSLDESDLRRVGYHIRAKRGGALFARCWLLVEGESEFWLMSHLAHVLGYDLEAEGVRCVEFAQCGVAPLVKLANDLGIQWHMLADGDESGSVYAKDASKHLAGVPYVRRVTQLAQRDVERCLWHHGFDDIYREAAGVREAERGTKGHMPPGRVIQKAVKRKSKPYLALVVADECSARGRDAVPPALAKAIGTSVSLARESVIDGSEVTTSS